LYCSIYVYLLFAASVRDKPPSENSVADDDDDDDDDDNNSNNQYDCAAFS
jgi:hypothetical protein